MSSLILSSVQDRVLTLRLNRLDKKNALTQEMYAALAEAFKQAAQNTEVRVVLLAAHPECFCAGNDMVDFLNTGVVDENAPVIRFMQALSGFAKPVVAAPAGIAVGVGVTLLMHCDLVYAGEQTRFSLPFVSLGICPEFAATYLLPRQLGHVRACELALTGEVFSAQKALDYGLVNALLPNAEVEAKALERARQIAQLPPNAVRTTKALLKRWTAAQIQEAIPLEGAQFGAMLKQPEALEAIGAFVQKRKPDFSRFS